MRTSYLALRAALTVFAAPALAGSIEKMPYPGEVALIEEPPGEWAYKSFPNFLPLYIFDGEPSGMSSCDAECAAVWPIVAASRDAKPMGDWTVVARADNRKQWAYKGKAVYTYFEDRSQPMGVGKDQYWYMNEGGLAFLLKAGVNLPPDLKIADKNGKSRNKSVARLLRP